MRLSLLYYGKALLKHIDRFENYDDDSSLICGNLDSNQGETLGNEFYTLLERLKNVEF